MLKVLVLKILKKQTNKQTNKQTKKQKQYIAITYYKCKLSLFQFN